MTFYGYMTRHYLRGHGKKSDLAKDMHSDKTSFPVKASKDQKNGHQIVKDYLESCCACDSCMEVFEECWEEYAHA